MAKLKKKIVGGKTEKIGGWSKIFLCNTHPEVGTIHSVLIAFSTYSNGYGDIYLTSFVSN